MFIDSSNFFTVVFLISFYSLELDRTKIEHIDICVRDETKVSKSLLIFCCS